MAIIKSSKKRIKVAQRNRKINLSYLKKIKEARKKFEEAKNKKDREKALSEAYKAIDKAAKKNIIHPNKAARMKSKLAQEQS
jgi:small subunit ribosomal protein S20